MNEIKNALENLLDKGYTPNEIAEVLSEKSQTKNDCCPNCGSNNIEDEAYNRDIDMLKCMDCLTEWEEKRFTFGTFIK